MKIPAFVAIAFAVSTSTFAQTSPPAAPTLTAGADFKGLQLDWDTVPGATWYQVEYKAHQNSTFVQQGDDYPATSTSTRFSFPLHLYDWSRARYRLAACNSAGCTRSAEVSVSDLRRDAVGYFKSSVPFLGGRLGASADLTSDGYTLVAAAPSEPSAYSSSSKGRIYVFSHASDGSWRQRARLDARTTKSTNYPVELRVSVGGKGGTVAVFMPNEGMDQAYGNHGEVDIYRLTNNVYTPTRLDRGSFTTIASAEIDDSGNLLVVRGYAGDQHSIASYRWSNGAWVNTSTVALANDGCGGHRLTKDGKTLVALCRRSGSAGVLDFVRVFTGTNWSTYRDFELDFPDLSDPHSSHDHFGVGFDRTGATIAVQTRDENDVGDNHGSVKVFHLEGDDYQPVATLLPGDWNVEWDTGDFGKAISISGDGQTLAIGHPGDYGTSGGVRSPPLVAGSIPTGGVYVYRLTGPWKLVNVVKPNYVHSDAMRNFGQVTTISGTGKTLVVGVPFESSGARGIGGNWNDATRQSSGALFMY